MNQTVSNKKLLVVDDSKVSRMVIKARVKVVHPEWEIINDGPVPLCLWLLVRWPRSR